jgi:N-acetylmuramoyl-L-alanine amidase
MRICIDPGHGGRYSGAVGSEGVPEKAITLAVGLQLGGLLSGLHLVEFTRRQDNDLAPVLADDLQARCDVAQMFQANVFVSLHCNSYTAAGPNGYEVFTNPQVDTADDLAAKMWYQFHEAHPDMKGRADFSDGDPDKESKFYVLVHTPCPAVLFELAFLSNPTDQDRLLDPAWQVRSAYALDRALREWHEQR